MFGFLFSKRFGTCEEEGTKERRELEAMVELNLNANQKVLEVLEPPKEIFRTRCPPPRQNIGKRVSRFLTRLPPPRPLLQSTPPPTFPSITKNRREENNKSKNAPRRNNRAPKSLPLVQHRKDNRRGDSKIEHNRNTAVYRCNDRDGVGADW